MFVSLTAEQEKEHISKAQVFKSRPVYLELEAKGLTLLPALAGIFLSYHGSSQQWHAGFPLGDSVHHQHRAPKWGEGLRSERKALLIALAFLWEQYHTKTGEGQDQLNKLQLELAE